jgi:hypothetical protein
MKPQRYSKNALRVTLQSCAAAIIACVLAVGFVSSWRKAAEQRNLQGAEHIQAAKARLARASERLGLIEHFRERYKQLVREGLTVRFDRSVVSDWFDMAIRSIRVGAVDDYKIGPDVPYKGPETDGLTALRVIAHRLEFNANAADEDEFAAMMSAIEGHVPGTTAQEACSLTRTRRANEDVPQLAVNCALIWYEFTPSDAVSSATLAGN